MNEISRFLKEHPHCTSNFCTTCGGIIGFTQDFSSWSKKGSIDIVGSIQSLSPDDLVGIRDWPFFIEKLFSLIPELDRERCVYPHWIKHFGNNKDYDFTAIRNSPADSFDPVRDEYWVRQLLEFIKDHDYELYGKPLLRFIGKKIDDYPEFLSSFNIAREQALIRLEVEKRITLEHMRQIATQGAKREDDLLKLENRKMELVQHYSQFDQKMRLIEILGVPSISLSLIPEEWSIIPDELLGNLTSIELTNLIKLLTSKISKRQKGPWKDLRNRLYQMRQKVYNLENGYSA